MNANTKLDGSILVGCHGDNPMKRQDKKCATRKKRGIKVIMVTLTTFIMLGDESELSRGESGLCESSSNCWLLNVSLVVTQVDRLKVDGF